MSTKLNNKERRELKNLINVWAYCFEVDSESLTELPIFPEDICFVAGYIRNTLACIEEDLNNNPELFRFINDKVRTRRTV